MDYYPFGMQMPGRTYSSPSYRFGFAGYEKDDEISGEGNNIYFGARMYDPRLGRFKSIDKYAGKYPFLTPYQYAGNNPILFMDNNGDSLKLSGGADEITKFKSILNTTFAEKIKVEVDEKGFVTMNGDASKLNANDKALYTYLNTVIADKKTTDIYLVQEKERGAVVIGSFPPTDDKVPWVKTADGKKMQAIDVSDMEKLTGSGASPEGALIHEIWEAFQNQVKGKSKFEDAHDEGKKAQGKVDGTIIGENWVDDSFNKTGSGIVRTLFTRGGKLHTLEITVDKGNITGTSVKAGWVIPDGKGKGGTTTITSIPTK